MVINGGHVAKIWKGEKEQKVLKMELENSENEKSLTLRPPRHYRPDAGEKRR